jgi:hypothetical protein
MAAKAASRATQLLNPDKRIRMDGIGYLVMTDRRTVKQRNRAARQEEMRNKIEASGYETHVHEVVKKLLDPTLEFDSIEVQRMKSAADLSIKMMSKFMPDLKSTEITGADGGDLVLQVQRKRFDGDD